MEDAVINSLVEQVMPDLREKVTKLPPYRGDKKLQLRWPQTAGGRFCYDLVGLDKSEAAGYVMGETFDGRYISVFMLSSGETVKALSCGPKLSAFAIVREAEPLLIFRQTQKESFEHPLYEAENWSLHFHESKIIVTYKPSEQQWAFHSEISGDTCNVLRSCLVGLKIFPEPVPEYRNGEDLGSVVWPVGETHALTIAGCVCFARMWLRSGDFS